MASTIRTGRRRSDNPFFACSGPQRARGGRGERYVPGARRVPAALAFVGVLYFIAHSIDQPIVRRRQCRSACPAHPSCLFGNRFMAWMLVGSALVGLCRSLDRRARPRNQMGFSVLATRAGFPSSSPWRSR